MPVVEIRRRALLQWGLTAMVAVPVAACGPGYDSSPDELALVADAARADAQSAGKLGDKVAKQVADIRTKQAAALDKEVTRANRPRATRKHPKPAPVKSLSDLGKRLTAARTEAAAQLPRADRYRAGLLASVIAGCAGAQALDGALGEVTTPAFKPPSVAGAEVDDDGVQALQQALQSEHAAVWVTGLATALLPPDYAKGVKAAAAEHRERRDAVTAAVTKLGGKPKPSAPAYRLPKPVSDAESAKLAVIAAENDALSAWRGVVEHVDPVGIRKLAVDAMQSSSVRATRWRLDADVKPAAVALP